MKFTFKIVTLPVLAAITFFFVFIIVQISGKTNAKILADINEGYFPARELSQKLLVIMDDIQRGFQDAVSIGDTALFSETDNLHNVFTDNNDHSLTGLTFGDESFFFGNVKADVMSTTFKTVITTFAQNDSLNSSNNISFDSTLDSNAYISEIGILDNDGNLVAVGKPTYPIKKNEGRFLTFQLQIDF